MMPGQLAGLLTWRLSLPAEATTTAPAAWTSATATEYGSAAVQPLALSSG